jgi:hypothetical protein
LKVVGEKITKEELFSPIDLFEKKNMPKVLNTLENLAENAAKQGFTIKWKKRTNLEFSPKEIQEAKKLEGVDLWSARKNLRHVSLVTVMKKSCHHATLG